MSGSVDKWSIACCQCETRHQHDEYFVDLIVIELIGPDCSGGLSVAVYILRYRVVSESVPSLKGLFKTPQADVLLPRPSATGSQTSELLNVIVIILFFNIFIRGL